MQWNLLIALISLPGEKNKQQEEFHHGAAFCSGLSVLCHQLMLCWMLCHIFMTNCCVLIVVVLIAVCPDISVV